MCGRFEGKRARCGAVLLGAALLLYTVDIVAQDLPESIVRIIERQCEDGSGDPEELVDYLTALMARPVDVNTAGREQLEALPLVTPFMVLSLMEYRDEYGAVSSEAELSLVDGFDFETVRNIRPFITFGNGMDKKRSADIISGRLMFRTRWNVRRDAEEKSGLPVPLLVRLKTDIAGRFGAGLVLESDAGESGFPDFYSMSLSAEDIRLSRDGRFRLKSAVAGDFSLRFAQGLVLWNGFAVSSPGTPSSAVRRESGVRPYNSTDENAYFHGAGMTVSFPAGVDVSAFYSDNGQDARVEGEYFVTKPDDGLHDSDADRAARDALREQVAGGNVSWHGKWFKTGITLAAYRYDKLDGRRKSYYNEHLRYDGWWGNASADFLLSFRGTRVFGEVALDRDLDPAVLAGAVCPLSPSLEISLLYRYYSKDYIAAHAGAYCRSNVNNEHGASASVRWTPVRSTAFSAYAEYTHFPFARFGVREPSDAFKAGADCAWTLSEAHSLYFKLSGSYDGGRQVRQLRLRTEYDCSIQACGLELSTRLEGCWSSGSTGILVYQQAGCSAASGCLRFSARLTLFAVEDWDSRIYSYEGDVPGAFSVPAYYGKGAGLYALVTYRPVRWLSMSLKCHAVKYTDRARDALGVRFQLTVPF